MVYVCHPATYVLRSIQMLVNYRMWHQMNTFAVTISISSILFPENPRSSVKIESRHNRDSFTSLNKTRIASVVWRYAIWYSNLLSVIESLNFSNLIKSQIASIQIESSKALKSLFKLGTCESGIFVRIESRIESGCSLLRVPCRMQQALCIGLLRNTGNYPTAITACTCTDSCYI